LSVLITVIVRNKNILKAVDDFNDTVFVTTTTNGLKQLMFSVGFREDYKLPFSFTDQIFKNMPKNADIAKEGFFHFMAKQCQDLGYVPWILIYEELAEGKAEGGIHKFHIKCQDKRIQAKASGRPEQLGKPGDKLVTKK